MNEEQWEKVFDQIREDLEVGDLTALFEMLDQLPTRILLGYVGNGKS